MAAALQDQSNTPMAILKAMHRLRLSQDEAFFAHLDEEFRKREKLHESALAAAAAKHNSVREDARAIGERIERERRERQERANEQRLREEAIELDRLRQEKAEQELAARRREILITQKADAERQQAEEAARVKAEADQQQALEKQRQAEREAQKAEERKQLAQNEESRQAAASGPAAAEPAGRDSSRPGQWAVVPLASTSVDSGRNRSVSKPDPLHQQYLDIHQRLKQFRKSFIEYGKQHPELKAKTGNARREIRKCVGQLIEGKGANRVPMGKISTVLREARQDTLSPRVDVRHYLLPHPMPGETEPAVAVDPALPGLFIYAVNIFAKAIIAQFINEAAVSPKTADPIGIVCMQIFAANEFRWGERALIDLLIAKYHALCPVLFGVYGKEDTEAGKARLGWCRDDKTGPWISEQRHSERMTGLGAGYAAIALRNFSRSSLRNPYPNWHYWQSLQRIVTVPAADATRTHFTVLKAMLEHYEIKFLELYGNAGRAALKTALIDFPNRVRAKGAAVSAVAVLADVLKRDKKLTL